uniref:Uncharacterized protein n=1 Tax=Avena sativa TaxID=4498 RepID=A0ACD5ZEY8_AVESA
MEMDDGDADKNILRQLVKDLSDKFDMSMRSTYTTSAIEEHTPMVEESDKWFIEPAEAKKTADEEIADEAKNFDLYRRNWEYAWSKTCGSFEHMTALSSMQFTCYTPGLNFPRSAAACTPATLQIFSIKLAEIAGAFPWPLSVYGLVAVRDVVDRNRNFLFSCDRNNSQELTQDDPFFRLVGPSRAILYTDKVYFEIELRVKGTEESEDKALITEARRYHEAFGVGMSTVCFKNCFCTLELCVEVVRKTNQATILGVQVNKGRGQPCPFEYGARVTCYPVPGKWMFPDNKLTYVTYPASGEIVMVDSKDGARLKGCDGYLHLPRNVISVETEGRLDVDIIAYSKSGEIAAQEFVCFQPKFSKISRRKCYVRGSMVVITVAWSLVATDKRRFMALG